MHFLGKCFWRGSFFNRIRAGMLVVGGNRLEILEIMVKFQKKEASKDKGLEIAELKLQPRLSPLFESITGKG